MPPVRNNQAASVHGLHPARPGRVDAAVDQRGDGEGEADREADIAEVEQRRMDGEADVLQDRVEVAALDRRRRQPRERIRGRQDEEQEGRADPALHRQHGGAQARRQIAAEHRDQRAEEGEDQHPEQHRALVVPPGAGDLVEQRLQRVRILPDVCDREIGLHVGDRQHREGERDQRETGDRDRPADRHHAARRRVRAPTSGTTDCTSASAKARTSAKWPISTMRLQPCRAARHCVGSCQTPLAFRLSATSFGM